MDRKARTRETTVNSHLAAALQAKHPRWTVEAESTRVFADNAAKAPDIVVSMPGGMSVILESEYAPATTVEADAVDRLGEHLSQTGEPIEQVVALRIPETLSRTPQTGLTAAIAEEEFDYCLLSGIDLNSPARFPSSGWITGDVDALASLVESISVSERQLSIAVGVLENGVSEAAGNLREQLLDDRRAVLDTIASALHQADSPQTSRMAMTIVANALTFHCAIASTHPQISTFASLRSAGELTPGALLSEWDAILEINYWPIFEIARRVLVPLPADVFRGVVGKLTEVAERLVGIGVTTIQEMAGQLFGRLIADRKFLATFYTRPPSAVLLAELAVEMLRVDYRDEAAVERLKVADLACGTGALLSAVYGRLSARVRRAGLDDEELHPTFMEQVFVGADIMPAAVHVTASMLSAVHPSVPFGDTNIHLMPYGRVPDADDSASVTAVGSLELIEDKEAASLFGTGRTTASGTGRETRSAKDVLVLDYRSSDLVIMNPPFARTVGQEGDRVGIPRPAFAGFGTTDEEQEGMSRRLAQIYREQGRQLARRYQGRIPTAGHGHAGLASNFIDLAHAKVKSGGVVAFVLPATFTVSSAWSKARDLLSRYYEEIVVVSIAAHGSTDRAFSDDTAMAEVLVVAVRRAAGEEKSERQVGDEEKGMVTWVGLADRPATVVQSLEVASAIQEYRSRGGAGGRSSEGVLRLGDERLGVIGTGRLDDGGYGQLHEPELARTCLGLLDSRLRLPRHRALPLQIARMGDLGRGGPGNAAIGVKPLSSGPIERGAGAYAAPFRIHDLEPGTEGWRAASYPVLWAHDSGSGRESRLEVAPDSCGELRPGCGDEEGQEVWRRSASRVHINLDFRLNSQRLGACLTPRDCIGGMAWPSFFFEAPVHELPIVLWLNTTLGLLGRWWVGSRQHQGRSRLSVGRIPEIPVLDCRKLSGEVLTDASEVFARFRLREFLPANEAYRDEVRRELDRAVLCDLLGLPESVLDSLETLRDQWCREPTVHGGKRTRPDV